MDIEDREDTLRISKSGCSIKLGWKEQHIVASVPHNDPKNCTDQWIEDAQRLCDGWNGTILLQEQITTLRAKVTELEEENKKLKNILAFKIY